MRGIRVKSDALNVATAEHLWIAARTFAWRTGHKVAANICWSVRRAVLADFGIGDMARFDRTWAATTVYEHADLWKNPARELSPQEVAGRELAELLEWAESSAAITAADVELLVALVRVSGRFPDRRRTSCGLLSADVSQAVGEQLGMSASTVRRRVSRTLDTLRCATQSDGYLVEFGFAA